MESRTLAQLASGAYPSEQLPQSGQLSYQKVREMRAHPTVRFARRLAIAPIVAADWTVESDKSAPVGAEQLIATLLPMRQELMRTAIGGCIDYGFACWELIYSVDADLRTVLQRAKPLLNEATDVIVTPRGEYNGLINWQQTRLEKIYTLLINQEREGDNHYGESDMLSVEFFFDRWQLCDRSNKQYDKKIAGAHWVIHYPIGRTKYNGVETDNFDVAKTLLADLESSGSFVVPNPLSGTVDELESLGWKVELLQSSATTGAQFIDRMKYLDALCARALGLPERAIFEGQFGTKAEASAHADFAIVVAEQRAADIVQQINQQLVNYLLLWNYGERAKNTVRIRQQPLVDEKRAILKQVYIEYLKNPDGFANEYVNLDLPAMRDMLGLPTIAKEAASAI